MRERCAWEARADGRIIATRHGLRDAVCWWGEAMVMPMSTSVELRVPEPDFGMLVRGEHHDPHAILGAHPIAGGMRVVTFHPEATGVELRTGPGAAIPMDSLGQGLWTAT